MSTITQDKPTTHKRRQRQEQAPAAVPAEGVSIRTSMCPIADEARTPVSKSEIPAGGLDARMQGNNVANRVIATARSDAKNVWRSFAVEIIRLTTDGRTQFAKAIKEWLAEVRKHEKTQTAAHAQWVADGSPDGKKPDITRAEAKSAAARVSSAGVQVSKLMTISDAWNGQATEDGALTYYRENTGHELADVAEVPYEFLVQYARTFSAAKAGRKPEAFLLRIAKALETTKPRTGDDGPDSNADMALHAALVALVNEAAAKNPAAAPQEPRTI